MHKSEAAVVTSLLGILLVVPAAALAQGRVQEREPNGSMALATPAAIGDTLVGALDPLCDVDVFALDIPAGTRLRIATPSWPGVSVRSADSVISEPRGDLDPATDAPILVSGRYYLSVFGRFHEGPPADCSTRATPDATYALTISATPEPIGPGDPVAPAFPGLDVRFRRLVAGRSGEMWGSTDRGDVTHIDADGSIRVLVQTISSSNRSFSSTPYVVDGFGNLLVTGDTGRNAYAPIVWRIDPGTGAVSVFASERFWPIEPSLAVAPNGDVWLGPAARLSGTTISSSWYVWRLSPLGDVLDSVSVSFQPWSSSVFTAFSPTGELYLSSYYGLHRIVDGELQLVVPSNSLPFGELAFDRDGYLYAVKGRDWDKRVALYDPALRLVNDTLAHLPFGESSYQLFFAPDRAGNPLRRLLALGMFGKFAEIKPAGVRAPGLAFPPLLPIDRPSDSSAVIGVSYVSSLRMPGAPGAVHWSVANGMLPPGVTLSETTGELSGVPHHAGSYTFSVRAQSGDRFGFARFTITVADLSFSVEDAINALLGGPALSLANVQFLDQHGNQNGIFDAGDVRALLRARALLPSPPKRTQP
jgi:hypothetical protein